MAGLDLDRVAPDVRSGARLRLREDESRTCPGRGADRDRLVQDELLIHVIRAGAQVDRSVSVGIGLEEIRVGSPWRLGLGGFLDVRNRQPRITGLTEKLGGLLAIGAEIEPQRQGRAGLGVEGSKGNVRGRTGLGDVQGPARGARRGKGAVCPVRRGTVVGKLVGQYGPQDGIGWVQPRNGNVYLPSILSRVLSAPACRETIPGDRGGADKVVVFVGSLEPTGTVRLSV